MKAKFLIIGVIVCIAMLAMLTGVSARADLGNNNPTCGANAGHFANASQIHRLPGNVFFTRTFYNCGVGGTFLDEIQSSSDGGNHWLDVHEEAFAVSAANANANHDHDNQFVHSCNSNLSYRLKVWDANGSTTVAMTLGC